MPPRYVVLMLLLLLGPVFAAEPDRLEGVHFGIGVGAALYSATTLSDGDVYSYTSVSSYTSLRLRLGQRWALEPALRLGRSGSSDAEEGDPTTVTEHADAYSVGMRVRSRLATVDQVDLVAAVGAWHTREWWRRVTDNPEDDVEAERETSFQATTSAVVDVALEYWINPRLSVSAEVGTKVFSASVYKREPEMSVDTSYGLSFSPSGDAVFHVYF